MSKAGSNALFGTGQRPNFAFVDADNVRLGFRDALIRRGIGELDLDVFDMSRLFQLANSNRTYVFSAVAENSEPEDWLRDLRAAPTTIFRSGILTLKADGSPRKQQGVDVMLAVQALKGAYNNVFQTCTLFSDDGDMLPLIQALEDLGKTVVVCGFGDPEKSMVAAALRDASDHYNHIGSILLSDCLKSTDRILKSGRGDFFVKHLESVEISPDDVFGGSALTANLRIFRDADGKCTAVEAPDSQIVRPPQRFVTFGSEKGLSAYFKLRQEFPFG